jgi:hypothetical protein
VWRPQLRRTDDDFRIYAQDARTVYRWDPGEARPEAEWSVPSESSDVEFNRLVVICEGPVEFVVDVGGALWAKPLAEVGLVPLPMLSYDWTIASDPAGAPDRLIAVEWMQGNDPPEALVLREVGLVDLHNVRERELRLGQSLIGHRDLLTWEGEPLSLGRAYWVVPRRYQGYECLLIVCMLKPHGAAIFFVDAATGRSLRTPAIAPCDVRDPTIVASNGKEYLVCQVPWREEGGRTLRRVRRARPFAEADGARPTARGLRRLAAYGDVRRDPRPHGSTAAIRAGPDAGARGGRRPVDVPRITSRPGSLIAATCEVTSTNDAGVTASPSFDFHPASVPTPPPALVPRPPEPNNYA